MKRTSWFLIALIIFTGSSLKSQTPEGTTPALNYSGLESKLKKSDADILDPKKSVKVKTWISRASLLVDIYNINNDILRKGMDPVSVKIFYKEPKEIQTAQEGADKIEIYVYERVNMKFRNGKLESWTETQKIHPDPLNEAINAINEAVKINTDGKADKDIVDVVINLKIALETEAVMQYDKKDFKASHDHFVKLLDLNKLPQMKNQIDTVYLYYGGRAAYEDSNYVEANRLFEEAAANKYEDPFLYVFRKQSYFASGDTAKGVAVITEGFKKYPENQSILIELINYYMVSNQTDAALKMLSIAKAGDPKNVSYVFAESTLYDRMGKFEDAEKSYKNCIEMDPNFFDANFNIAVLYFNKAVKIYEDASKVSDNTAYEKSKTEGDAMLLKAVPYLEKAHEIDSTYRPALETLKTIFYRLKMDDKYQEVVKKLSAL
jgi:tetratricopeptide (TPR) repeat protein